MTTSGPVVSLINPTSTESDYGQEQHGYCSDTEEGQPPGPDLKPTEPR
jgi:hypothetical protein